MHKLHRKAYGVWALMKNRCYNEKLKDMRKSYSGVTVCDEWMIFDNFKHWFIENYINGSQIDKDAVSPGNTIYSPSTCCFVTRHINILLPGRKAISNKLTGITPAKNGFNVKVSNRYSHYEFKGIKTLEGAIKKYRETKLSVIRLEAKLAYSNKEISKTTYQHLINWNFPD